MEGSFKKVDAKKAACWLLLPENPDRATKFHATRMEPDWVQTVAW